MKEREATVMGIVVHGNKIVLRKRQNTYERFRIQLEYEMQNNKGKHVSVPNEQNKRPFRLYPCAVFL
jgi:hypothetical protein